MINRDKQHNRVFGSRRRAISDPLAVSAMLFSGAAALWSQDTTTYSYSVLYTFGGPPDGFFPAGGLVRDKAGNLYGTTLGGGNASFPLCNDTPGCGVVFKVTALGKETILYNFTGGTDGRGDGVGTTLVRDDKGNLYGESGNGGDLSGCGGIGCGVIYRVDSQGRETNLYSFTGGTDGNLCNTQSTLLRDKAGNLYGTAICGGNDGYGVVFKLAPPQSAGSAWTETVLHSFSGSEGRQPEAGLIEDGEGNLYGTTAFGGSDNFGVVFMLDRTGKETVLYNFSGGVDGFNPYTSVVRDQEGNFYGVSLSSFDHGVVYKLDPAGNIMVLHSFTGGADGDLPAGVIRDPANNLYGTTLFGGDAVCSCGVVYKIDPAGNQTILHTFLGGTDGGYPGSTLTLDQDANLYGTATNGGDLENGVVFKFTRSGGGSPQ